ncbi:MAG: hypothetical protein D6685_19515 [Bacteroidetes bacterium]|nr:MAG: hypothetical protein D6685_19515 [Bacteroidota bacterium]
MADDLIDITRRQFGKLARLWTGRPHRVRVKTRYRAYLLEVEDVNFHHDSAVFLPDYEPPDEPSGTEAQNRLIGLAVVKACYEHARYRAGASALVVGHTDRSGDAAYNQRLSELRAENVWCVLEGRRERWAEIAHGRHTVKDYQQILAWVYKTFGWPCDPGEVDGVHGAKTTAALQGFQKTYTERMKKPLQSTGAMSRSTWAAFFDLYMLGLERLLEVDQIDLATARQALHFLPCPFIGCGEDYPITPDRQENYKNPVDRRVEILFFDPGEEPVLDCARPGGTCEELYKKKMYTLTPLADAPTLHPTFTLALTYLGPEHVAQDAHYRCSFELVDAGDKAVKAGAVLTPDAYRVLVQDNHALKGSQIGLLGGQGDAISRPANYRANGWERDVRPAVALRVEVQHLREGKAFALPADRFFVRWEVEDPAEDETPWDDVMSPARPRTWLQAFRDRFKRKLGDAAAKEDDNALRAFGGVRDPGTPLKATDVLFTAPFRTAGPQPLAPSGATGALTPVVPATKADGTPVGHADAVFFPPPVGGDNYRFRLSLVDQHGNAFTLEDGGTHLTTGTFTYWRKTVIDLLVTFDNVDTHYINWDMARKAYRAAFVEVEGPKEIKTYDEKTWKKVVQDYFINTVKMNAQTVKDNSLYDYANYFLPDLPLPAGADRADWCWTHGEALGKLFLKKAYKDTKRTSPRSDKKQDDAPGLFVFLCKDLHAGSTALGMYMGDREFFMVTRGDGTVTFVHEMGHALYLRHALIRFDRTNNITEDLRNKNWLDHDQGDAIVCAMAYQNDYFGSDGKTKRSKRPVEWHFCAVCALTLRHYDRVRMGADAAYQTLIYRDLTPIEIVDGGFGAIAGKTASMKKNAQLTFHALGKAEPTLNNVGGPFRKDLTSMPGGRWVSSDPALADFVSYTRQINGRTYTFQGRLRGKNTGTGSVQIHFEIGSQRSETITVDITN